MSDFISKSTQGNSRAVISNQDGIHPDLTTWLSRYMDAPYLRPIADHTCRAFESIEKQVSSAGSPIILDSGCGVGQSTFRLAKENPNHLVIGIDQSIKRLERNPFFDCSDNTMNQENALLVQADCVDFWRLVLDANWQIDKHTIFYPNPWPKKAHLKRRWHGHPVFPEMCKLCDDIELRTNWQIYAQEFQLAWQTVTSQNLDLVPFTPDNYFTLFEKKYHQSEQTLYRLCRP